MPFQATVQSRTRLATTSVTSSNFGNAVFATANAYFKTRLRPYSTIDEVNADGAIPKTSNAYKALQHAFSQVGAATPIYLARRQIDSVTLTVNPVADNADYGFTIKVTDTTNDTEVADLTFSTQSGTGDTAAEIAAAVVGSGTQTGFVITDNLDGSFEIVPDADRDIVIEDLENLVDTYTTTESAAEMFSAIQDEDNVNWYFICTEERDETFVTELADAVEATETSDYKKQYRVAYKGADTLMPTTDPNTDLLGVLADAEYRRTHGEWHHEADEIFPELAACAYQGGFFPGTQSWKFMTNLTTTAARDPSTKALLTTAQQGYIRDRNASWVGQERGTGFMHGGTMAIGTDVWIDVQRAKDWIDDTIEVRVLNKLLNRAAAGQPLTFKAGDVGIVKNIITGILREAVDRNILLGFEEVNVPETFSFEAQAKRELRDITWTGYLAGKIHFAIIDGVLTYKTGDEE